jgi:hypothetical protein
VSRLSSRCSGPDDHLGREPVTALRARSISHCVCNCNSTSGNWIAWLLASGFLQGVVVTGGGRGAPRASESERVPAVGHDRLTGDPGGLVCGEQEDAACDVGWFGLAVDYPAAQAGIGPFRSVVMTCCQRS